MIVMVFVKERQNTALLEVATRYLLSMSILNKAKWEMFDFGIIDELLVGF